jgi:acetyl esterase
MSAQLDPQAQALLEAINASGATPLHELPVADARARMRAAFIPRGNTPPPTIQNVEDTVLKIPGGDLRMRLYRPGTGILPVALFLHGGGWTVNDLDTHDRLCRLLSGRSGWLLASLDYRRAPEHKHPAALEDACFAYRWLLDNAERIEARADCRAVVGESSGATMAAGLTRLLQHTGAPVPTYQVLAYPATDLPDRWPSYRERGDGYTLDRSQMLWFFDNYLPVDHEPTDPYLFPLAAPDLEGTPPTLIMTAEFDPLRDEGRAYAQKLAAAGVPVEHVHADDQMHGFLLIDRAVGRAGKLIEQLADALAAHATSRRSAAAAQRGQTNL